MAWIHAVKTPPPREATPDEMREIEEKEVAPPKTGIGKMSIV